jgi:hypothetical protein
MGHEFRAATARASLRYDIENDIIVDAKLEPLTVDERSFAKEHLRALGGMELDFGERKSIVICDRGYPSKEFITYLQDKEIKYVMRVAKRSILHRQDEKRKRSYREERRHKDPDNSISAEKRKAPTTNLEKGELETHKSPKSVPHRHL